MGSSPGSNDPWDSEVAICSGSEIAVARSEDVDDEFEDAGFDTASASKFESVPSSIYLHAYETGPRYHKYRYEAFADMFPGAQVVGYDLSPIQPFWVPSSVRFVVGDIEDEWVYGDDWDLVHIRQVFSAIRDPLGVCKQSFSHLKPGGWIEVQDFGGILKYNDDALPTEFLLSEFYDMTNEALSTYD
ncbi:S-adenosyl-L-methionine-dependent methyltransferase [Daldinia vernicosa]|uniref:S-adenosyl-L-methionine-dependent methyltransferase n=1 Tax=Daldinia vernicosa TaxID=114800 RepID=UPI0020084DB3|nr:S-adenosyl-L-methionine-dependent methyltransferase [Daldinia vernicosa]KAI0844343.1 S-adenosyl-L-methionine-dependent methyltransferase [Daldinia vernicosa]